MSRRNPITVSPSIRLHWYSCSTFRKLGTATSQSAARSAGRTSPHRLAPCRIRGLPRSAHSAERREAIFHPRYFRANSHTDLVPNRCAQWGSDGRNEASNRARAGGRGGANARADAHEVNTGHCRRNYCGRSSGPRLGYKPTFTSSHRRRVRKREPGTRDFGSSGPTARIELQLMCGRTPTCGRSKGNQG
jgi:hypothetical protein